jgi:TonB family protein
MNAARSSWSRHVWIWGFVFLFLSHAFAVFWLAERQTNLPSWQKPAAFLYLGGSPDTDLRIAKNTALRDPTLFALPHAENFSGGAWLNFRPQVLQLTNWIAPPEWLAPSLEQLGKSFDEYVATNRPSEDQLLASLRATAAPEVRMPDQPVITHSTAKIEGALAARKLVFTPELPNVPHSDVLAKTIVTVSVNGNGVVESASIAKDSGSKWADDSALRLARAFSFEPAAVPVARARDNSPPVFGRLVFTWNTVPPTNAGPSTANVQ